MKIYWYDVVIICLWIVVGILSAAVAGLANLNISGAVAPIIVLPLAFYGAIIGRRGKKRK